MSPYVRTRETFHAIASAWGGHERVRWHEDPRIREQVILVRTSEYW